jgi:hypothetical protein
MSCGHGSAGHAEGYSFRKCNASNALNQFALRTLPAGAGGTAMRLSIILAVGAVLLGSSGMALADPGKDESGKGRRGGYARYDEGQDTAVIGKR